ncbi:hypothetical protein [Planktomarina sp.]|uniref:hypothetical protein n=1 Tax=Planktomarina sp. TaxID=2024851 RepID=UPI003C58B723
MTYSPGAAWMDGKVTLVSEADIGSAEFPSADALFFATTAGELVPVMPVNKTMLGKGAIGPITAQVLETY